MTNKEYKQMIKRFVKVVAKRIGNTTIYIKDMIKVSKWHCADYRWCDYRCETDQYIITFTSCGYASETCVKDFTITKKA